MAGDSPARRWWTPGHSAVAWIAAAWVFALKYFDHQPERVVNDAIRNVIVRVFSGFPWAQQMAYRAQEALEFSLATTFGLTLFVVTLAAPLAFAARLVARARVRAGHADPLDRVRGWLAAGRGRAALVVAAVPLASQALFIRAMIGWNGISPLYFAVFSLAGGIAQIAVLRAGLRAVLAPTMGAGTEGPAAIDPDQIRFHAVAVTRETRVAIGALAAVSLAVAAWVASRPEMALFKDARIFEVIASYVAIAAASAVAFRRASRISVGVDGIYVGGTSRARFYAYRDLDEVRVRAGDIELVRRERVVLRLQLHGQDATRREAILARIHEAMARVKDVERDAAANFVTSRSVDHVVDSARGGGDYRMPSVSQDALWALVEGQAVDATTRTVAAQALARAAGGADRERLRVAAAHCADPRVRVALEELGAPPDEAAEETAEQAPRKSATA